MTILVKYKPSEHYFAVRTSSPIYNWIMQSKANIRNCATVIERSEEQREAARGQY